MSEKKKKGEFKTRYIVGAFCAALAVTALVLIKTPMMGIFVVIFSAMACYEICNVAGMQNKAIIWVAMPVAAAVPALLEYRVFERLNMPVLLPVLAYFFLLVILMLANFDKTKFTDILIALLASILVPGAMISVVMMRNIEQAMNPAWEKNLVVFLIFYVFCCAWLTDTCAFLVGVNFGKTKLCPKVSPKKSVEGAVGALILTAAANAGFAWMFNAFFLENHTINILAVFALSFPLCAISMIGDLTASVFKRNFGTKDFGKIFPGHGGVMDRFDSYLFVAPAMLGLLQLQYHYGWSLFFK